MTWQLGIPSTHRADTLNTKTLPYLARAGVDRERIFVFVTHDEVADYSRTLDIGLYKAVVAHDAVCSVAGAHNAIVRALGPGDVVHMDDDIVAIDELQGKHLVPVDDLPKVIDEGFRRARHVGATLWGIYPSHNAFYMKNRSNTGLNLCIGHLFGQIISDRECEFTTLDVKNDYERSLLHFMADGCVVRMDWLAADTKVYEGKGGMQTYRTPERAQAAAEDLMRRFPGLVRWKKSESPYPEIALVNPKAK